MTCRQLLVLSLLLTACVDDDDDDDGDTFADTGTERMDSTDAELTFDDRLCDLASNGPFENYSSGNTVDTAPIVDIDGQAASIAVASSGGFVGFESPRAGTFSFGRSLDARLQVIDLNGRQPPFVEDVRDVGCLEVQVRSTYMLEAEQYWLLLDGGVPFITLVGDFEDDAS